MAFESESMFSKRTEEAPSVRTVMGADVGPKDRIMYGDELVEIKGILSSGQDRVALLANMQQMPLIRDEEYEIAA